MKVYAVFLSTLVILCIGCSGNETESLLVGHWAGYSWTNEDGQRARDHRRIHFEFKVDGTYAAQLADEVQNGTYYVSKDKLYTHATDKKKIVVQLDYVSQDTVIFKMNRSGSIEKLGILRIK